MIAPQHSRGYRQLARVSGRQDFLAEILESVRFVPRMPDPHLPQREDRNYKLEVSLAEWYPEIEEGWEDFKRNVLAIRADCETREVGFLAFCIPPMHLFHDPYWREFVRPVGGEAYERGKEVRPTVAAVLRDYIVGIDPFITRGG